MKKHMLLIAIIITLTMCLTGCLLNKKVYEHWEFDYAIEDIKHIKIVEISEEFNKPPYKVIKEIESIKTPEVCNDVVELTMYTFASSMGSPIEPHGICIWIMYNSGEYDIISLRGSNKYRYDEKTGMIKVLTSWRYCVDEEFEALINKYLK